jgi:hypothetical protein
MVRKDLIGGFFERPRNLLEASLVILIVTGVKMIDVQ